MIGKLSGIIFAFIKEKHVIHFVKQQKTEQNKNKLFLCPEGFPFVSKGAGDSIHKYLIHKIR